MSRSVVVTAYTNLEADGYVEARQGAGTRVRAGRRDLTDGAVGGDENDGAWLGSLAGPVVTDGVEVEVSSAVGDHLVAALGCVIAEFGVNGDCCVEADFISELRSCGTTSIEPSASQSTVHRTMSPRPSIVFVWPSSSTASRLPAPQSHRQVRPSASGPIRPW